MLFLPYISLCQETFDKVELGLLELSNFLRRFCLSACWAVVDLCLRKFSYISSGLALASFSLAAQNVELVFLPTASRTCLSFILWSRMASVQAVTMGIGGSSSSLMTKTSGASLGGVPVVGAVSVAAVRGVCGGSAGGEH